MMDFEFIEPDQPVPQRPLYIVLAGLPAIGKTSTAFTVEGAYCIDADDGLARAVSKKRPQAHSIRSYAQYKAMFLTPQFADELKRRGVKTVIIDTVGSLLDDKITPFLMAASTKNQNQGGLSLQGYSALSFEYNAMVNRCFELGFNVIAVCHSKEEEDDASKTKSKVLDVKGGTKSVIMRKADMLGFITYQGGERILDFNKSEYALIAKNTAGLPPMIVPHKDSPKYDNFMQTVLEATMRAMTEMSEGQLAAARAQEAFLQKVDGIDKLEELVALEAEIAALDQTTIRAACRAYLIDRYAKIALQSCKFDNAKNANESLAKLAEHKDPDYRKAIWVMASEAAKANGLDYDKEAKKFNPGKQSASQKGAENAKD